VAIDKKYGRITMEKGDVGADEPVVVFRARDQLLPKLLVQYFILCQQAGSPPHHLFAISEATNAVRDWQLTNPTRIPTSDSFAPKNGEF
jgi:hypothetical protein